MVQYMLMVYSIIVWVSVLIVFKSEIVVILSQCIKFHYYCIHVFSYRSSVQRSLLISSGYRFSLRVRGPSVCLDIQPRFHFPRGCVAYIKQFAS